MGHAKLEVFEGEDGQWYVRVKAANGEPMSVSEGYVSKSNAERARKSMIHMINSLAEHVVLEPENENPSAEEE